MPTAEAGIPVNLQPKAAEYAFDLEVALQSVVGLRATVPDDAFTADTLGTERAGSAVHFRQGLFLTIGYLITAGRSIMRVGQIRWSDKSPSSRSASVKWLALLLRSPLTAMFPLIN